MTIFRSLPNSLVFKEKNIKRKNHKLNSLRAVGLAILFFLASGVSSEASQVNFNSSVKKITLNDGGAIFEIVSGAQTVEEFLTEQKLALSPGDLVFPEKQEKIYSGANLLILRSKAITIEEGGKKIAAHTFQKTIEQALWENKEIELDEDDVTLPARTALVKHNDVIAVTHVLIQEEIKKLDIDFKTISNEDADLGWRVKKVTQKGEKGIKEVKYKVIFNNGKEISRKIIESAVTKEPVSEIVTQGTLVKIGKVHTGAASWYAYTGELCAANPWLPMGSYVRVTNKDNGKSVIVKINDRGPFGNGRIIDLDKVAFSKIASIGAGVANVKMEVITN